MIGKQPGGLDFPVGYSGSHAFSEKNVHKSALCGLLRLHQNKKTRKIQCQNK